MKKEHYLTAVGGKLERKDFILTSEKINELDALIAYKSEFKAKWLATQMNLFVTIAYTESVDQPIIEAFSAESLKYALDNNQGLPRGLQSGIASFAVLASNHVSENAQQWVAKKPKSHVAAMEMPIIFDLLKNELFYCKKTPMWGAIYYKFFRSFIEENLRI